MKKKIKKQNVTVLKIGSVFPLLATLFAFAALVLAYEANQISKNDATALVSVIDRAFEHETMMITGCETKEASYQIDYFVVNEYIVANKGGRDVSLIKVKLTRGAEEYKVNVFPAQSFDATTEEPRISFYQGTVFSESGLRTIVVPAKGEPIDLPLEVGSGTGQKWLFQGERHERFRSYVDAYEGFYIMEQDEDFFNWSFEFSDGSVYEMKNFIASYSYNPNIFTSNLLCGG